MSAVGQINREGSALARFGCYGDGSVVIFRNLPANRQSDAGPVIFVGGNESFKNGEDLMGIFLFESDAVVLDFYSMIFPAMIECVYIVLLSGRQECRGNLDDRLICREFKGIAEEVGE